MGQGVVVEAIPSFSRAGRSGVHNSVERRLPENLGVIAMRCVWLALSSMIGLTAAPALAHDHQWFYDRSEWQADLARGRALARIVDCDAALLAEARAQFALMDAQTLPVYLRIYRPAAAAPAEPAAGAAATPPSPSLP
jgi:hypothetical protein